MRKYALHFAVVLAFALVVSAQEAGSTTAKSGKTKKAATAQTSDQTSAKAEKTHQVTGCLSGPNDEGAYVITNLRHRKGIEVGGNDDLKNHVGHKVQLTGTWTSAADIGEKPEAAEKEKSEKGERHLKVSDIKMISENCHSTAAASHGKKKKKMKTPTT
jgi:hypothetical protein